MKSFLVLVLVVLCVPSQAFAQGTWKIVAGSSVGPIQVGMDVAAVDQFLTVKDRIQDNGVLKWVRYAEGVEVHVDRGKVLQVLVNVPAATVKGALVTFVADGGVQVGGTVPQLESVYGRGYVSRDLKVAKSQPRETYYAYVQRGLGVLTRGARVAQLSVFPAKN